MKKYGNTTAIMVSLMVLVFWLVILFLDGAFSSHSVAPQQYVDRDMIYSSLELPVETIEAITGEAIVSDISAVDVMVTETVHQQLGNSEVFKDLNVLEYIYSKNKNPELLPAMIEKFLAYYQFDKANKYLTLLIAEEGDYLTLKIDPRKVIYTRLHDSSIGLDSNNSLDDVFLLVEAYRTNNLLTPDDEYFYKGLKALWVYDYDTATAAFAKITDARYKDFKSSYEASLANYTKIKNPPVYYRDGLVSLTLLKNGYFSFAKRLALRAATQNKEYILPHQVLAYTNFLMHNRESAKEYFLTLSAFDQSNVFLYNFLIGVSYYRYGDYEQAVLYLNQVTDPGLQIDVYRYMLLSYIAAEDTTNMLRMFHNLLGQDGLQSSDFSLFFDQMFYVPFRSGLPFTMYTDNQQLVDMYLGKCSAVFSADQSDVCDYGQIGLQLADKNLSSVGDQIISLTSKYQQSHLYHVLGDYYTLLKQYTMAKESYVKALSISDSLDEQKIIKDKINVLPN